jgi:hypothetical protein
MSRLRPNLSVKNIMKHKRHFSISGMKKNVESYLFSPGDQPESEEEASEDVQSDTASGKVLSKSMSVNHLSQRGTTRRRGTGTRGQGRPRKKPAVGREIAEDLYSTALNCIFVPLQDVNNDYFPQKLVTSFRDALGMDDMDHEELLSLAVPNCTFEVRL